MTRQDKLAYLFFIALLPITTIALVWSVSGLSSGTLSNPLIFFMIVSVAICSHFRIQLPRTNLHLTVSDTIVVFALIAFGGELAVILTLVASILIAAGFTRPQSRTTFLGSLNNISISVVTVLVTAFAASAAFGVPKINTRDRKYA